MVFVGQWPHHSSPVDGHRFHIMIVIRRQWRFNIGLQLCRQWSAEARFLLCWINIVALFLSAYVQYLWSGFRCCCTT